MSCILYRETASVAVIGLKRTEAANAFFGSLCTEFPATGVSQEFVPYPLFQNR